MLCKCIFHIFVHFGAVLVPTTRNDLFCGCLFPSPPISSKRHFEKTSSQSSKSSLLELPDKKSLKSKDLSKELPGCLELHDNLRRQQGKLS